MEETRMRACTLLSKVWPRICLLINPNLNMNELKVAYAEYYICVSDFDSCFWSPQVFLQHLSPLLSLPTFAALWLTILDFMDKYMIAGSSDLLVRPSQITIRITCIVNYIAQDFVVILPSCHSKPILYERLKFQSITNYCKKLLCKRTNFMILVVMSGVWQYTSPSIFNV